MGKIKAGTKTSKIQRFFKEQSQPIKQEVVEEKCPVVQDFKARKYAVLVRKQLKQQVTNLMVADVKLATRYDNKLDILKQQLLNEVDGSFQANALPLEQLKQKVEELDKLVSKALAQEPTIIEKIVEPKEQSIPDVPMVYSKTIEKHIEEVIPLSVKLIVLGLGILNIILLLK